MYPVDREVSGNFFPPSPTLLKLLCTPAKAYFSPVFVGLERRRLDRPALWVGNHTLYGLTDVPLLLEHLYLEHGVMLRALGDRAHLQVPIWGELLKRCGMVLGSPEECAALMQSGQHVLVFPGGGREVMRRKNEAYQLIWKQRTGFARMAIQHGYDIIPFASVGADETYKILWDADDFMRTPVWRGISSMVDIDTLVRGGDMLPPISRGIGLTWIPKPQRYYFGFGRRVSTRRWRGNATDESAWSVRYRVEKSITAQMDRLLKQREAERYSKWSPIRRLLSDM